MTCDQVWQAGRYILEVHSNETNKTGTVDVTTSITGYRLKLFYFHYKSVYGYLNWQDGNLS